MEEAAKHYSLYWINPGFPWKACRSVCVCVCAVNGKVEGSNCQYDSWYSLNESELVSVHIWPFKKRLLVRLLGERFQQLPSCPLQSPLLILQALKWPHWCCWPSVNSQHTSAFPGYAQLWNTLDNSRCQWPYPWLRWWHCCHLLSTLWGIYSSSPALLHKIWESLWSLDCPDSNRWTPEEDAPSSDQVMGGGLSTAGTMCFGWATQQKLGYRRMSISARFWRFGALICPKTINGHAALHMWSERHRSQLPWPANETGLKMIPAVSPYFFLVESSRGEECPKSRWTRPIPNT